MTMIGLARKYHSTGSFCAEGWLKLRFQLRALMQDGSPGGAIRVEFSDPPPISDKPHCAGKDEEK
jgi:hypothetical protein